VRPGHERLGRGLQQARERRGRGNPQQPAAHYLQRRPAVAKGDAQRNYAAAGRRAARLLRPWRCRAHWGRGRLSDLCNARPGAQERRSPQALSVMSADEQQIRDLVATWMSATEAGDVDAVLALMADD